jgi:hypothetical protein
LFARRASFFYRRQKGGKKGGGKENERTARSINGKKTPEKREKKENKECQPDDLALINLKARNAARVTLRVPRFSSNQCQASSLRASWVLSCACKKEQGLKLEACGFSVPFGVQKEL